MQNKKFATSKKIIYNTNNDILSSKKVRKDELKDARHHNLFN